MNKLLLIFKYIIYNLDILILEEISIEKMPRKKKIQKIKKNIFLKNRFFQMCQPYDTYGI